MVAQFTNFAVLRRNALPWLAGAWFLATHARADGLYGAEAKVERPILASHGEDGSAAGTTLTLEDRATSPRSLAELLREAPGARVTQTGGLGAFSSVSLRGADDNETLVLLNEIPLLTPDGGALDLSFFPVEFFARVEVFRGGAPVWLNSGAIGGVVRLIPREATETSAGAALGAGSFGTFQAEANASVWRFRGISSRSSVVTRGSRGNYPYYLTDLPYASGQVEERVRQNAEHLDANAYQELVFPTRMGDFRAVALLSARTGGFPGPGAKPTPQIHRRTERALVAVSYEVKRGRSGKAGFRRLQIVTTGAYGRDRYTDFYGQLGISRQTVSDDDRYRSFTRVAGTLQVWRGLELTATAAHTLDVFQPQNRFQFPEPRPSTRHSLSGATELAYRGRLFGLRFELRPSARIEWSQAELHAASSFGGTLTHERTVLAPTFRMGALLEITRGLALSASASTGTRLPSLYELFGDRGLVLASPELRPVRAKTIDMGLTAQRSFRAVHAMVELRAFAQERADSIAMYRTAQWQVGHENLSRVQQLGTEAGLQVALGSVFSIHGATTWLDATDALGRRLPLRARHVNSLRPEATWRFADSMVSSVSLSSEIFHRSFTFVDVANTAYVEGCLKVAAALSVSLRSESVRLSARMDDVADARCADVVGYPLPGRSMFFSLGIRES